MPQCGYVNGFCNNCNKMQPAMSIDQLLESGWIFISDKLICPDCAQKNVNAEQYELNRKE